MIVSKKKPAEELFAMLDGAKRVGLVGCKSCASACAVGGEKECAELKAALEARGVEVVGVALPDESCHKLLVRRELKPILAESPEAVVSLACGSGCQTVAELCPQPVYPANDTLFVGQTERVGIFREMCRTCGSCVLGETGGICPVTKCAKSLVNGPCGGQRNGKCEVNPENDCAWVLIYERLKAQGRLGLLEKTAKDKDASDHVWPASVNVREAKK